MKILSSFEDYYDSVEGNHKSPVYQRETTHYNDVSKTLRPDLLRAKIETVLGHCKGDIWMVGHVNNLSSVDHVRIIPILVGIAGEYHYYIKYYNSVLNMTKIFYNYTDLSKYHNNVLIERTFKLYETGLLDTYCRRQFGCVNFILVKDCELRMIKEPCLSEYPEIEKFLLPKKEMYDKIESFLLRSKELDIEYKKLKMTQFLTNEAKQK